MYLRTVDGVHFVDDERSGDIMFVYYDDTFHSL